MANQAERNVEIGKIQAESARAQEDVNKENTKMAEERAQIMAESDRVSAEAWRLNLDQNACKCI